MKKTIIYVIIVLMLGSMFASTLPFQSKDNMNVLLLQSVEEIADEALLQQSADIMEQRLRSIGIKNAGFTISASQATIGISFKDDATVQAAAWFLSSRGDLGFYETGSRKEVIGMLQAELKLLELLQVNKDSKMPAAILGAFERSELTAVTEQLLALNNQDMREAGIAFAWGAVPLEGAQLNLYILKGTSPIDASMIENAVVDKDRINGNAEVFIDLDRMGAMGFHDLTGRSISKAVAIVVDNIVYAAPVVQEAISGGKCMISASFSDLEAAQLAAIISSGELPLDFKIVK